MGLERGSNAGRSDLLTRARPPRRYFGRARDLPGVKELFEANARPAAPEKDAASATRAELRRNVDAAYYGYTLDEEDGSLLAYEARKEKEALEALEALMRRAEEDGEGREDGWEALPGDAGDGVGWRLPTLEEVQEELVERRRRRLLDQLG